MGAGITSRLLSLIAASGVFLLAACKKESEEIKVYRVSKPPAESTASKAGPLAADVSLPPDHPPIGPAGAAPDGRPSLPPDHPPIGSTGAAAPAGAPATGPAQSGNSAGVPSHWESQPLAQMRQASFLVRGEAGAIADISLVTLGTSSGNVLDNVNRWLGQLSQPPITPEQLEKIVQHLPGDVGHVAVVDLEGNPEGGDAAKDGRIIAAIAPAANGTAFYKLRGNPDLAVAEKENFLKWVAASRQ